MNIKNSGEQRMNTPDLIASVIKSLAWPGLVLFLIIFFGQSIKELLSSLKEFSVSKEGLTGKFEKYDRKAIETEEEIVEAKIESAAILPPAARQLLDKKEQVSENAGRIDSAWDGVEKVVRGKLEKRGFDTDKLGVSALLQTAHDQNIVTDNEYNSLLGLNTMRNLAIHGPSSEIDDKRTQEFLVMADAIKTVLHISNR